MIWLLAFLAGYLPGSIPFGVLLTRLAGGGDLRAVGSGNIGATNVLRTGRKGLAAATLLLDMAKGLAAVMAARHFLAPHFPNAELVAGAAALIGHCYPVWLKFRGGKGVATLMGVALGLAWPIGLVYAVTWIAVLAATRVSSLAGISAAVSAPLAALALDRPELAPALAGLALLVVWLHRPNIARLLAGREPRVDRSGGRKTGE